MTREGGCLCGAVRYRAHGEPTRTVVCHRCGATVDDTGWIRVDKHVWTRSAQHWVVIPHEAVRFPKSSTSK